MKKFLKYAAVFGLGLAAVKATRAARSLVTDVLDHIQDNDANTQR